MRNRDLISQMTVGMGNSSISLSILDPVRRWNCKCAFECNLLLILYLPSPCLLLFITYIAKPLQDLIELWGNTEWGRAYIKPGGCIFHSVVLPLRRRLQDFFHTCVNRRDPDVAEAYTWEETRSNRKWERNEITTATSLCKQRLRSRQVFASTLGIFLVSNLLCQVFRQWFENTKSARIKQILKCHQGK